MFLKKWDGLQLFCVTAQYMNKIKVFYIKFNVICKVYITDCIIFAYNFCGNMQPFLVMAIGSE